MHTRNLSANGYEEKYRLGNDRWCIVHNPAAHAGKYMHTCTKTGLLQTLLFSSVCYKHKPANDFFCGQPNFQCLILQGLSCGEWSEFNGHAGLGLNTSGFRITL